MADVVPLFSTARQASDLFARAMVLDESRASWPDAERLYAEVTRLDPAHWEAWNNLGVIRYRLGRKADALDAWGRAMQQNPLGAETHNNVGSLLQMEGKLEVAAVFLQNAVRLDPDMAEARINLALALQATGKLRDARRHWRYYLEHWPGGEEAPLARKNLEICLGRVEGVKSPGGVRARVSRRRAKVDSRAG